MKSHLALLPFAAAMLLAGCASQSPQMASAEKTASLQCQYMLADNGKNYDEAYLRSGRPAVDDEGNTYGLSLRGHVAYQDCMAGKGYEIAEGGNWP